MENLDVILLALFCFIMGAALVGLILYWRGGAPKRSASSDPADPDLEEMARLYRNRKTNRMVVGLDADHFHEASELNSEQHRRLGEAASVLQTWLAEGQATTPAVHTQPPAPHPVSNTAPEASNEPARSMPASTAQEVKPVAARPLEALNRVFTSGSKQAAPKFKSIAAQINEILQSRLPGSPFESQGISLVEMPDQGVVVRVGSEEYPGVEAVPDPAVRAFIKAAVAAWEANTRAGIK